MNDRAVSLLEQYDIVVEQTRKGRGAILCETDRGLLIFKEYGGNPDRLQVENALLCLIEQKGLVHAECLIETKEGELYVKDHEGIKYILKSYPDARECNIREKGECLATAALLAKLHMCTQDGIPDVEEKAFSILDEYEKRNREMKKIRKFLHGRSQKTWFEIALMECIDRFCEQGLEAAEGWKAYRTEARAQDIKSFCHGDYQYHNLLFGRIDSLNAVFLFIFQ